MSPATATATADTAWDLCPDCDGTGRPLPETGPTRHTHDEHGADGVGCELCEIDATGDVCETCNGSGRVLDGGRDERR